MNTQDVAQTGKVAAWLLLYDGHTWMFNNVLEGLTEADARKRLDTPQITLSGWPAAWYRNVMKWPMYWDWKRNSRHTICSIIIKASNRMRNTLLDSLRADWERITPRLREAFASATAEKLNGPNPWPMPDMDQINLLDMLLYCIDRESYCIGQLGLWRRLLGYPPMRYQ